MIIRLFFQRSWEYFAKDILTTLPGLAMLGLVLRWMVPIAGADFIPQENMQSWPTSYFLKVYGKWWFEETGFTVSGPAFLAAFHRGICRGRDINCDERSLEMRRASLLWRKFPVSAILSVCVCSARPRLSGSAGNLSHESRHRKVSGSTSVQGLPVTRQL